jgi:hypothetical protein
MHFQLAILTVSLFVVNSSSISSDAAHTGTSSKVSNFTEASIAKALVLSKRRVGIFGQIKANRQDRKWLAQHRDEEMELEKYEKNRPTTGFEFLEYLGCSDPTYWVAEEYSYAAKRCYHRIEDLKKLFTGLVEKNEDTGRLSNRAQTCANILVSFAFLICRRLKN